jgi:hypothetical protein
MVARPVQLGGVLVALMLIGGPSAGWSAEAVPSGYRLIAAERVMPATLLYAVALTESGRAVNNTEGVRRPWPWTLNVAGSGYVYATRLEAWQALRDWLAQGQQSIDIGLMQVNWRYHQARLGEPWQALEPYHNLRVGAGILQACYATAHDWWASVGCYHAPSHPARAARYRRRVESQWRQIMQDGQDG